MQMCLVHLQYNIEVIPRPPYSKRVGQMRIVVLGQLYVMDDEYSLTWRLNATVLS